MPRFIVPSTLFQYILATAYASVAAVSNVILSTVVMSPATARLVNVPTLVMLGCAAFVTIAAVLATFALPA